MRLPSTPSPALSRRLRRPLLSLALLGALASGLFAGCSTLDEQQRRWIFQASADAPWPQERRGPRDDGLENVWIEHPSALSGRPVTLHALWSPNESADAPLLLYLHGARRNIEASRFRIAQMRALGFSVLAIDYRGFGQSTDELPSEAGVLEDARAAWDWLARQHPGRPRYVFGHSLGGAIAVQLAEAVDDERGLIVEGSFTSIADVFRTFKWGWLPVTPLITQRFDSADAIARVGSPVLIVHGSRDGLILPQLGRALYERAVEPKRFVLVEGGTHYSTNGVGQPLYREALRELFGIGAVPRPTATGAGAPAPAAAPAGS
ncbi:alpha/beta hydrolase [Piscinibacter sakaiensis]|uniref:Putative exported protein n=1 Tax=Piscinibacter sakaiensis TaxID=1547922 RepID=A0A0K8P6L4_PISS1|nr:alpha/beta fold hydrolase [Piscinibacter sakaiensis]GAP38252.1 putative exported protein [Piscinibacter sakaiensis]